MSRLNSLALFVLLLSALIYGIIEWRTASIEQDTLIVDEQRPDFIAEKLQSKIYSKSGQLSHTIEAERMEHYADLEVSYFEAPLYTLYPQKQGKPWKISAQEATLYKDNRVELKRQVLIQATEIDSLIKEIHCKEIVLDLKTNIISSEQAVIVVGRDFTMYGSGLIIDLNTKQMTLTQHERTIYKKHDDS
ncbi:LPS export ABC transporter periplasmic protein LptC [Colwellia sp. MT41]|uniref:Lipopolysaccharide export system protein LptC n=1 Tax=Colwellia marinimaniae TaxID=1513592 RepID=A0ABQ0MPZ2_9GAMM|nr:MULTISPECIES: LPS export ABC transporter periplasmic protein LptC [Colwellia]ALO36041.1 LPS export ABC transporter periplasmic protein LptC [Colwellia sp. MT41]GAW94445.1 lipopolysaccharide export system protein LptC [Colwellia marinimaniae]